MATPFDINSFKSGGLTLGGVRPALFQISFANLGTSLDTLSSNLPLTGQDKLSFTCRAASLPPSTLGVVEAPYFGRRIPLAGDRTFPPWVITVMNDEDWAVRSLFESWSNALNSLESNIRSQAFINGEVNYKADFAVIQYSKTGGIIAQYNIVGAWPSNIDPIQLDWDNQNQIETFGVTLSYDYWLPDSSTDSNSPNPFLSNAQT